MDLQTAVANSFSACLMSALFPNSTVVINLQVLSDDGSLLATCINAASLALVDAGIPMTGVLAACTSAFIGPGGTARGGDDDALRRAGAGAGTGTGHGSSKGRAEHGGDGRGSGTGGRGGGVDEGEGTRPGGGAGGGTGGGAGKGSLAGNILLDTSLSEEQELSYLTVATHQIDDKVVLLRLENKTTFAAFETLLESAIEGCHRVRQVLLDLAAGADD